MVDCGAHMTKKAVWTLPNTIRPARSVDWCIPVPDDPYYRAAFWGALLNLASAYNWQDDPDHKAREVALVWRDIIDRLKRCEDCPEVITGEEWEDALAICESLRWHNGILQGFCCGEWVDIDVDGSAPVPGDTTQPSSGTRPAVGASTCYSRNLSARDTFLIPFGVQNDDIITVTGDSGAWSPDSLSNWTCVDGTPFVLGQCIGSRGHDGGDPDPSLYHGQLIIAVDGQFFSATDGPVTLSGLSAGQHQAVLMPNFVPGSGAGGTVQFKVCIEAGGTPPPTEWCRYVDFTLSDYGFGTGSANIAYAPGSGFEGTGSCNGDHTVAFPTPPSDQVITELVLYFSTPPLPGGLLCTYVTGSGCQSTETPAAVTTFLAPGLNGTQANNVVLWESGAGCTVNAVLAAMQLKGTGTPPSYGAPC